MRYNFTDIFGPDYINCKLKDLGNVELYNEPVKLCNSTLMPGGYIISHIEGAYLSYHYSPSREIVTGPYGVIIELQTDDLPIRLYMKETNAHYYNNMHFELYKPTDVYMIPPTNAFGESKFYIIKVIPHFIPQKYR